jgi:two-component system LytT family response regulator
MRVVVVDDESPARKKLLRMLAPHGDVEVVGEASCGEEAVVALESSEPDVVFLDVQMPDMDGFEVLRRVRGPATFRPVFVTAYDAFAVRAFEVNALDYLLKPVDARRFDAMLERVRGTLAPRAEHAPGTRAGGSVRRVLVTDRQRSYYVETALVDWIESDRNYVVLHAAGAEHIVRGTLEAFAKGLDPAVFVRISRSHVVNREAIAEIRPWTHGERQVLLRDGATLTWTRRYRE